MILDPQKFQKARGDRKLSDIAHEMSKALDRPISYQTLRNWELGRYDPTDELFKAYCKVVKKSPRFFIS